MAFFTFYPYLLIYSIDAAVDVSPARSNKIPQPVVDPVLTLQYIEKLGWYWREKHNPCNYAYLTHYLSPIPTLR